jgi:hypothetical protein
MKNFRKFILWTVLFLITACSSTPLKDRLDDSKDIITFSFPIVLGFSIVVGPFFTGLKASKGTIGGTVDGVFSDCLRRNDQSFTAIIWKSDNFSTDAKECSRRDTLRGYTDTSFIIIIPEKKNLRRLTKIEIEAGFMLGFRFGFNPGELLDFLGGFFGYDLYDDDIEYKNILGDDTLENLLQIKNQ